MITAEIQKLDPSAEIVLFEIDGSKIGAPVLRMYSGTDASNKAIVWQGRTYEPWAIEATGFEVRSNSTLPRPTVKVSNIFGDVTSLCRQYQDMLGAKFTRIRTFAKYLDGQPTADPMQELPRDVYLIDRKTHEDGVFVSFELASPIDVMGVRLPRGQVVANCCRVEYRGARCGYAGPPVADVKDQPTSDPNKDVCGHRETSCKLRFGTNNPLPYAGFPAAALIKQ